MKIIDTTTFFEENLMMDLRFNILDPYVDEFVVCEATFTHSGNKKKINFKKENFPKFLKKINHIVIDKEPKDIIKKNILETAELRKNSIARINYQRNSIQEVLKNYSDEDFIIYSDNDEIPNLEKLNLKEIQNNYIIFEQKLFYYKFNLTLPNLNWFGSKGCKKKNLSTIENLRAIKNKKYSFYRIDTFFSDLKHQNIKIIKDGGWHFSNLKTIDELERKFLNDENHAEYEIHGHSVEKIKKNLENNTINYNHYAKKNSDDRFTQSKLTKVEMSVLPDYIKNNIDKYKDWLEIYS